MSILSKILLAILTAFSIFAGFIVALVFEENWRGERDWKAFVQEHKARGESIDFQPLVSPMVPDDQNFAMTPLLAPLFQGNPASREYQEYTRSLMTKLSFPVVPGKKLPQFGTIGDRLNITAWQSYAGGDVLEWMKPFDAVLGEISESSRRPYARFPVQYEKGPLVAWPHLDPLRSLAHLYLVRAFAELNAAQTDKALEDTRTIFRLADSFRDEPEVLPQLARILIWQEGLQVVQEGLWTRRWTEGQLTLLQEDLARADFLKDLQLAFHGEQASINVSWARMMTHPEPPAQNGHSGTGAQLKRFTPNGFFYRMALNANLYCETYLFNIVDIPGRRIRKDVSAAGNTFLSQSRQYAFLVFRVFNYYELITVMTMPAISNEPANFAHVQSMTDYARHRLRAGAALSRERPVSRCAGKADARLSQRNPP